MTPLVLVGELQSHRRKTTLVYREGGGGMFPHKEKEKTPLVSIEDRYSLPTEKGRNTSLVLTDVRYSNSTEEENYYYSSFDTVDSLTLE